MNLTSYESMIATVEILGASGETVGRNGRRKNIRHRKR